MAENANKVNKPKRGSKLCKEAVIFVITELANIPFTQKTQEDISNEVEARFKVSLTQSRVSQIKTLHKESILEKRLEIRDEIYFETPIADPAWRLKEWAELYDKAETDKDKANALRGAKSEIGDDIKLVADAITSSGNMNIVNIISNKPETSLDDLIVEQETIMGGQRKKDRFTLS